MVDFIGQVWFQVCGQKNHWRECISDFCVENPMEGESIKEDFPNESILNTELGARKMYFDEAVNQ